MPFPGFGTLVALQLLLFGFLFLILGMISEYLGLTFNEVRARPRYLVRDTHGVGNDAND